MRLGLALAALLLVAGCVTPAEDVAPPASNATTPGATVTGAPQANVTLPVVVPVGERGPVVVERYAFAPGKRLVDLATLGGALPEAKERETYAGLDFFTSQDAGATLKPWAGPTAAQAYEVAQEVEVTIRFTADAPGVTQTKALGFPPVGGWFGTPDRWAGIFFIAEAPDTIEAGKVYTLQAKIKPPEGGFFFRPGETMAIRTFTGYQTVDNSPISWVVGGADPAGITVRRVPFNITAPNALAIVEKTGNVGANPSGSSGNDPAAVKVAVEVPPEAVYVVLELVGKSSSGEPLDVDLHVTGGGKTAGDGSGPSPKEIVVIGPGTLATVGRSLEARVGTALGAGGSFVLKATAYAP